MNYNTLYSNCCLVPIEKELTETTGICSQCKDDTEIIDQRDAEAKMRLRKAESDARNMAARLEKVADETTR